MPKRRSFKKRLRKFAKYATPFAALAVGTYLGDKYLQHQRMLKNKEDRSQDAEVLTARPAYDNRHRLYTSPAIQAMQARARLIPPNFTNRERGNIHVPRRMG